MYNKFQQPDKYVRFKKLLAFVSAIGLWAVSMFFSYSGFKFDSTEVLWFGVVLALVVTVVELVFNTKVNSLNPTLLGVGILCYVYGVYTNITGFYVLQHGNLEGFFSGNRWIIPVFAGLVTEILPEALFAWSIGSHREGDLIGNISDLFSDNKQDIPKPREHVQQSLKHMHGMKTQDFSRFGNIPRKSNGNGRSKPVFIPQNFKPVDYEEEEGDE